MTLYLDTNLDNLDNAKNSIAAKDLQKGKATSMFYDEGLYFVSAGLNLHTLTIAVFCFDRKQWNSRNATWLLMRTLLRKYISRR